jgi:hypothetical protein
MRISPRRINITIKPNTFAGERAPQNPTGRFFSDDPDATEKLVDKIERLKKRQGMMKRANQLIRKADREGLADLGFSQETITRLFSQDYAGRVGFPNYALANNSANIRRLEKRLAAIQNAQPDETTEEQFPDGVRLVDNVEANRLQIFFPEFPRKRSAANSNATAFTGPRLPEPGNGTGATAQPTSPG